MQLYKHDDHDVSVCVSQGNKTKKFHFLATKEHFKRGLEEIRTAESFIASKERLLKVGKLFSSSPELSYSLVWSRSC